MNTKDNSTTVKRVSLFFSFLLLAAVPFAAFYTGEVNDVFSGWVRILISPCRLVTDYYMVGNLPAAFFNAGICGLSCTLLMYGLDATCYANTWAGYFLVIAHCFYGLNFVNMWPPIIGIYIFCKVKKIDFDDNLAMAMFSTAFGPFFSEILFRYPFGRLIPLFSVGNFQVRLGSILLIIALVLLLGFTIPAMLPGAQKIHKGYNLYNGGLAFGLLGLLIYSLMYNTFGEETPNRILFENELYAAHGNSYALFCNGFFTVAFSLCILIGLWRNGWSFKGYDELLQDSGYRTNFLQKYGRGRVWMNLGIYGLFMLLYFDIVILFTDGAGFTGATCGVILAAMTFAASGQHPKNVWPILLGFVLLSVFVHAMHLLGDRQIPWTLSTQGYMNAAAFATGLCPFTGRYGRKAGILAGLICATMCTSTSAIHGGFVLYNGGLTAGITALILTPFLDYYAPHWLRQSE